MRGATVSKSCVVTARNVSIIPTSELFTAAAFFNRERHTVTDINRRSQRRRRHVARQKLPASGFGKALLAQVLAAARARAVRLMRLEVRIGNERALKMYEKAGFKRVGLRRGYYPTAAGREDAVLMDADLTVR